MILPFTSGGFIYIALVTIVPELLQEKRPRYMYEQTFSNGAFVTLLFLIWILFFVLGTENHSNKSWWSLQELPAWEWFPYCTRTKIIYLHSQASVLKKKLTFNYELSIERLWSYSSLRTLLANGHTMYLNCMQKLHPMAVLSYLYQAELEKLYLTDCNNHPPLQS